MDSETINKIINDYESKLKKDSEDFKLTDFEKILMQQCLKYGYEFCLQNTKNK